MAGSPERTAHSLRRTRFTPERDGGLLEHFKVRDAAAQDAEYRSPNAPGGTGLFNRVVGCFRQGREWNSSYHLVVQRLPAYRKILLGFS